MKVKTDRKTLRDAIRGSVPDGKLKHAKIVLKDNTANSPVGGFTEYDRAKGGSVCKLGAPTGDDAFGISIRAHEAAHATVDKPSRKKPLTMNEAIASQIIGDVRVEDLALPRNLSPRMMDMYRRAKLTVAMRDVHNIVRSARLIKAGKIADSVGMRNANMTAAVRSIGMLSSYGACGGLKISNVTSGAWAKLRVALGQDTFRALSHIANVARNPRNRNKAIGMLVALMEKEPDSDGGDTEGGENEGDILSPVKEGDGLDGEMTIRDLLPKSDFCAREKRLSRVYAPSGVIINPTRYVAAIVSGDGNGLFSRRLKQKSGGCVLIDASGSMGTTARNLTEICQLVPMATVGYYSGADIGKGELCIYAKDGRRLSGALPEDSLHGGNCVDLPAIRWLLQRPKPWVLVSDLEFCSGVLGSEIVAHALVERLTKRGELKVYRSLDEAYEAFGGKGHLHN